MQTEVTLYRYFYYHAMLVQYARKMVYFTREYFLAVVVFILTTERALTNKDHCPNVKNPIASVRMRRHIAFPDGSTISMTTSVVKTFMTHVPSGWYTVIEADLAYHLPDAKFVAAQERRKLHHRQKREFWESLQGALELQNMNGQSCVIRSICEAKDNLAPPGRSLVHDILRIVFTAPLHEQGFNEEIGLTHNELLEPNFCDRPNDCPFSLLNFVLELNKPPK